MALLEILTRTYKRPVQLEENKRALERQSSDNFRQIVLVDNIGLGVGRSHFFLVEAAKFLRGDYVWILDDDDICIYDDLVFAISQISRAERPWGPPEVILARFDHRGTLGVLPSDDRWGRVDLKEGEIGMPSVIVRSDIYRDHVDYFKSYRYASDYDFIKSLLDRVDIRIYWYNKVIGRRQFDGPSFGGNLSV